jgi:hypothetical protein
MREVDMLKRRDAGIGKIDFVDIASPSYRAEDNFGVTFVQVCWQGPMGRLRTVVHMR